jgi:hypothetical protein
MTGHPSEALEEFRIFAERNMHFLNLWTIYNDLLSTRYVPSVGAKEPQEEGSATDIQCTMMLVVLAYFYSLIEDDGQGLNAFRIWRERYPEEEPAIAAVEAKVAPFRKRLKVFRNRLGFHGSRSRAHELSGLELFNKHQGSETWEAMKIFKSLAAALFRKDLDRRRGAGPTFARQWLDDIVARAGAPPTE